LRGLGGMVINRELCGGVWCVIFVIKVVGTRSRMGSDLRIAFHI